MAHRRVNFGGVSRSSGRNTSMQKGTSPNKSSMRLKGQDLNARGPIENVAADEEGPGDSTDEDPVFSTDDEDRMDVDLENEPAKSTNADDQDDEQNKERDDGQHDDQGAIDAQLAQEGRTKPRRDFTIKDEHLFMETDEGDDGKENNGKDEALLHGIEKLKRELVEFAKGVSPIPANRQEQFVKGLLVPENEELIRYVGCLVMGGTATKWYDLLTTDESREAIVVGITARALKEHVFGDYLFGGDKSILDRLMKIDTGGKYHCGKKSKIVQWDP